MQEEYENLRERAKVYPVKVSFSGVPLLVAEILKIEHENRPSQWYIAEMNSCREVSAIKQFS